MSIQTPLPELDRDYPVSKEQIVKFQRDGHILLRGVAHREEVSAYRVPILAACDRLSGNRTPLQERDTYGKAFLKGMNLWTKDGGVRRFVLARRFAKLAADLLGVEGVRVYHDQALRKEPCGGVTPWHQDQHYWPLDTCNTLTMWMPLVDVTAEMGTMHFASGSHCEGYLGDMPISDAAEQTIQQYIRTRGYEVVSGQVMAAGDASFHYGWTLHGAPGNSTTRMREVMTVIWFEEGARVTAPDNPNRARDLERWLPALKARERAASELNPLVYHRDSK